MEQTTTQEATLTQEASNQQQPDINKSLGDVLWGVPSAQQQPPTPAPVVKENENAPIVTDTATQTSAQDEIETIELNEYFKNNFGLEVDQFKEKWNKLKDIDSNPPTPQETQWANDESKRIHELIKEGKTEDVWRFLDQQRQLQRLETLNISNVHEAEEIIKANLRFKHNDLSSQQIDMLFKRQYSMPGKPSQGDMEDDEYASVVQAWENDIKQREQYMIIDATIAKPEIAKYKSNITLPEIQRNEPPTQIANQEDLAKQEAFRAKYLNAVGSNYQNFKGYSVKAIDGDVELPISYLVTPEEQVASKQMLENFNSNEFLDSRWFDKNGNPNVTQIQEDLYLLINRDKIFQKIANEASAQRYLHHVKTQNNINLNGVTNNTAPTPNVDTRTDSEKLGDALWGKR